MLKNIKVDVLDIKGLSYKFPPATNDPIVKNLKLYPNPLLGEGGFGRVEKAYSFDSLGKRVEIAKKTNIGKSGIKVDEEFIKNEVIMMLSVATVKFYNVYYEGNNIIILMEYIEGTNGEILLNNNKTLNKNASRKLLKYLLEVRSCMDSKGATHRDIKPGNIVFKYTATFLHKIDFDSCTLVDWNLGCLYVNRSYFKTCYPSKNGTRVFMCPMIFDIETKDPDKMKRVINYILSCTPEMYFGSRDDTTQYFSDIRNKLNGSPNYNTLWEIIKSPIMDALILSYCDLWTIAVTVFNMVTNVKYDYYNQPKTNTLNDFKNFTDNDVFNIVMDILNYPNLPNNQKNASYYLEKMNDYNNKITYCEHVANKYQTLNNIYDVKDWREWEKLNYKSNGSIENIKNNIVDINPKSLFQINIDRLMDKSIYKKPYDLLKNILLSKEYNPNIILGDIDPAWVWVLINSDDMDIINFVLDDKRINLNLINPQDVLGIVKSKNNKQLLDRVLPVLNKK